MVVSEAYGEVGAAVVGMEAERVEALVVEMGDALVEGFGVGLPGGDRIVGGSARRGEDGIPELVHGLGFGEAGKDEFRPGRGGVGEDGPVDGVAGDELHGRLVGLGGGDVHAGDSGGILAGEQGRIGAGEGEPGGSAFEGGGDAVSHPLRGVVEGGVLSIVVAGENGFVVGVDGRNEQGSGLVGMLGDAANKRHHVERGGDEKFLAGLEIEADVHGDSGEAIELFFERERGEVEGRGGYGGEGHRSRVEGVGVRCKGELTMAKERMPGSASEASSKHGFSPHESFQTPPARSGRRSRARPAG